MKAACILLIVSALVAVFEWIVIIVSVPIITTHFLANNSSNMNKSYFSDEMY